MKILIYHPFHTLHADFERPSFTSCPRIVIIYAEREQITAQIDWNVTAEDNSGDTPDIWCDTTNVQRGVAKEEGNYYVTCRAEDVEGNEAFCAFMISVRGKQEIVLCREVRVLHYEVKSMYMQE